MSRCPKHEWENIRKVTGAPVDPDVERCVHCGKIRRRPRS